MRLGKLYRQSLLTLLLGETALAMVGLSPSVAAAAEAQAKPAVDLSELVVTARRREERLIDVPVAASTLSAAALERYATTSLDTIGSQVAGVSLARNSGANSGGGFSIRGVGNLATDFGTEQPVAIVVDGVQITRARILSSGAMFDLQRTEVLKGPQALFFGKDSPAGVVSLTSHDAGRTFEGYMRMAYEFTAATPQVEGAVTLPITDSFSMRLAGRVSVMTGGYIKNNARPIADPFNTDPATGLKDLTLPGAAHNIGPGTKDYAGRVTLAWRPTDNLDVTSKTLLSRQKDYGNVDWYVKVLACGNGAHPTSVLGVRAEDPFQDCNMGNRDISYGLAPTLYDNKILGAPKDGKPGTQTDNIVSSLSSNYQMGDLTLSSITGFYYARYYSFDDAGRTVYGMATTVNKDKSEQYSQEFRVNTNFNGPLNFTAGAFAQYELRKTQVSSKFGLLGPITAAETLTLVAPTEDRSQYIGLYNSHANWMRNVSKVYSVFGQGRWKIREDLELAAGARVTAERKHSDLYNLVNRLGASLSPAGVHYDPRVHNNNVSPEVTLTWKPERDLTTYVAYKTGFLSAGVQNPGAVNNYQATCQTQHPTDNLQACENSLLTYSPEKVKGFEGGVKGYLFDHRLLADLVLYRYKFTGLQVSTFNAVTIQSAIVSATSRSQGVEFALQYQATPDLQLHSSVAYTDLRFIDYANSPCPDGQQVLPFVPVEQRAKLGCYATPGNVAGAQFLSGTRYGGPPLSVIAGATYNHEVSSRFAMSSTVDVYHYNRQPRRIQAAPGGNPYTLVNASVRIYQPNGPWEVALIATNLFNKLWWPVADRTMTLGLITPNGTTAQGPGGTDLTAIIQAPRFVTLQVTRRF